MTIKKEVRCIPKGLIALLLDSNKPFAAPRASDMRSAELGFISAQCKKKKKNVSLMSFKNRETVITEILLVRSMYLFNILIEHSIKK